MQWSPLADIVSIITRPCGPYKLARTIQKCFDSAKGTVSEQAQVEKMLPFRQKTTLLTAANAIPEEEQKTFGVLNTAPDSTDAASSNTPNSKGSTPSQESSEMSDPISTLVSSCQLRPQPVTESTAKLERTPKILVVDDNFINLNLMLTFLRKRRLQYLDSAENGQLAVDAVERTPGGYDLIFMGKISFSSSPVMTSTDTYLKQTSPCQL
jgi:hypothetical protein